MSIAVFERQTRKGWEKSYQDQMRETTEVYIVCTTCGWEYFVRSRLDDRHQETIAMMGHRIDHLEEKV